MGLWGPGPGPSPKLTFYQRKNTHFVMQHDKELQPILQQTNFCQENKPNLPVLFSNTFVFPRRKLCCMQEATGALQFDSFPHDFSVTIPQLSHYFSTTFPQVVQHVSTIFQNLSTTYPPLSHYFPTCFPKLFHHFPKLSHRFSTTIT